MRIRKVEIFATRYDMVSTFLMSNGHAFDHLAATLVKITTDEGLIGWGEQTPFPGYMAAHATGARANVAELASSLIGTDPTNVSAVQSAMRRTLKGHHGARSAIDMACWDIKGKQAGQSVAALLGGIRQSTFPVLRAVGVDTPAVMANQVSQLVDDGYSLIQLKLSGDWVSDLARIKACLNEVPDQVSFSFDANGGFRQDQVMALLSEVGPTRHYLEQPCDSVEACLAVRERTSYNLILDESLAGAAHSIQLLVTKRPDGAMLKMSRFGGITPTAVIVRVCESLGIPMIVEDGGAGDVIAAASAQMAAAADPQWLLSGSITNVLIKDRIARDAPRHVAGHASVSDAPGLGLGEVDEVPLGAPEIVVQ